MCERFIASEIVDHYTIIIYQWKRFRLEALDNLCSVSNCIVRARWALNGQPTTAFRPNTERMCSACDVGIGNRAVAKNTTLSVDGIPRDSFSITKNDGFTLTHLAWRAQSPLHHSPITRFRMQTDSEEMRQTKDGVLVYIFHSVSQGVRCTNGVRENYHKHTRRLSDMCCIRWIYIVAVIRSTRCVLHQSEPTSYSLIWLWNKNEAILQMRFTVSVCVVCAEMETKKNRTNSYKYDERVAYGLFHGKNSTFPRFRRNAILDICVYSLEEKWSAFARSRACARFSIAPLNPLERYYCQRFRAVSDLSSLLWTMRRVLDDEAQRAQRLAN